MENVIIIGGGPAGLSAAIYTARAGFSPLVFAGSPAGGQLTLTSYVENYPGFESILGAELIEKMRQQAKKFGARIVDENVVKVDFSQKPFIVKIRQSSSQFVKNRENELQRITTNYNEFQPISTNSVIIATGAKALWLNVPGEEKLRGKGVSACATCDGFFFRDKVVAVVGGGDTAMEEALTLTKFAKKVYIIHRRDSFRASKIMQQRVFTNPKIEIIWNATVEEVLGEEKVEGVRLRRLSDNGNGNEARFGNEKGLREKNTNDVAGLRYGPRDRNLNRLTDKKTNFATEERQVTIDELKLDGLFVAIGHKPDTDIFKGQIEMDEKGYIITGQRKAMEVVHQSSSGNGNDARFGNEDGLRNNTTDLTASRYGPRNRNRLTFNFNYHYITSKEGVFAAGDCIDPYYRQAATSVGTGVAAALEVERWLESQAGGI